MTEKQLRDERRALLTWFARHENKNAPAHWQRNVERLREVNHDLYLITKNPIFENRNA